jgi:hypothetical protein
MIAFLGIDASFFASTGVSSTAGLGAAIYLKEILLGT